MLARAQPPPPPPLPHRPARRLLGVAATSVAAAALLTGCGRHGRVDDGGAPAHGVPASSAPATVDHVVDGDTVVLRFGSAPPESARLLGIDTPETVKPGAPVDCFGPEASARTKALLTEGTLVQVQRDVEARDRYGRLLLYVWRRADGLFVNGSLLETGHARTLSIEPNHAHRALLSSLAATARSSGRGLWGACPDAAPP